MKTAEKYAMEIRIALEYGLRFDWLVTTSKLIIEAEVEKIKQEAFNAGLTRAAEIATLYCETVDHALVPKAILAERDKIP